MSYVNGDLGFWMSGSSERPRSAKLVGDVQYDFAIIGAGFTGLWTAYFIKKLEPQATVAILEAHQVGYGASGRNGGWVSALVPGNRKKLAEVSPQGLDGSVALQREFVSSVDDILDTLKRESIDADQYKGGTLSAAHTSAGYQRLLAKRESDLQYGLTADDVQVLDELAFQERINIHNVRGGLYYPNVARINPAKAVHGLADVLRGVGVDIYENSRVLRRDGRTLHLGSGTVAAAKHFVCTEGYSSALTGDRRLIPINSSIIATDPLAEEDWQKIGWTGMECLNDSAHTFIYAQRTADDRIAIGGRGAPYRFNSGTGGRGATSKSTVEQLKAKLKSFFPDVQFDVAHAWSGVLGVSRDWNGSVQWDPLNGIGSSSGYAGHGVTAAFVGGRTLAELATDRATQRTSLPWVGYRSRQWEPEPLRWLGVHAMYRLFGMADSWEERRGSSRTSLVAKLGSRLAGLHE